MERDNNPLEGLELKSASPSLLPFSGKALYKTNIFLFLICWRKSLRVVNKWAPKASMN
jgi:hypothetical protein